MPVLQTTSNLDIFSDTDCLIPEPNGPPTNHIHIHLTPREFSTPASTSQTGTNPLNLYPINTIKLDQKPPTKNLSLSSLNVSSVGDFTKTDCILDFVTSQDLDIVALCETWLKGDASDSQCIAEFTPADYPFLHWPCPGRHGGGVGVLIHRPLSTKTLPKSAYPSFTILDLLITTGKTHFCLTNIYQLPPSPKNESSNSAFLSEFASYLEILATHSRNIVIVGDFNLHLDDPNDPSAINFVNLIESHGIVQYVQKPTH